MLKIQITNKYYIQYKLVTNLYIRHIHTYKQLDKGKQKKGKKLYIHF